MEQAIRNYLDALAQADLKAIMALFAPNAIVISPLYGRQSATAFYQALFEDTQSSVLELVDIYMGLEPLKASVHFKYHWIMADQTEVKFDVVDVIAFNEAGAIESLQIIYDTAQTRPAFENLQQNT